MSSIRPRRRLGDLRENPNQCGFDVLDVSHPFGLLLGSSRPTRGLLSGRGAALVNRASAGQFYMTQDSIVGIVST